MYRDETKYKHPPAEAEPSLRGLVAWLETKDPEQTYDYLDNYNCLLCQYLKAQGRTRVSVGGTFWSYDGAPSGFPPGFREAKLGANPWTFGAALARARAATKDQGPD